MEDKSGLYIVSIVGVVAIVALVILTVGARSNTGQIYASEDATGKVMASLNTQYDCTYYKDGVYAGETSGSYGGCPYIEGMTIATCCDDWNCYVGSRCKYILL